MRSLGFLREPIRVFLGAAAKARPSNRSAALGERSRTDAEGDTQMIIHVEVAGRRVTSISVPLGTEEVTIEVPPGNGGATKEERPLIVLTDR